MTAAMCESLPSPLRDWVKRRAEEMGLPGPDNYILPLIRLEKQRLELAARRPHPPDITPASACTP